MPQAANIVINDGATTPVSHTFTPLQKDEKGVIWWEQTTPATTSPLAAKKISYRQIRNIGRVRALEGSGKVVYVLEVPTLETLSNNSAGIIPPPTLAYREVMRIEFDLAERSTKQERKDTRVLAMNLLGSPMAIANIDDLQPTFA